MPPRGGKGAKAREDVLRLVEEVVGELLQDLNLPDVRGLLVFGSATRGALKQDSDVDVIVFCDGCLDSSGFIDQRGLRIDLLIRSLDEPRRTFEDESLRNRESTWEKVCFWLNAFRRGVILRDPDGVLKRWKDSAAGWAWTSREVALVRDRVLENLELSRGLFERGRLLECVISARDAVNLAAVHALMRRGEVPSYRPKEIYPALPELGRGFEETYRLVTGAEFASKALVDDLLSELAAILSRKLLWSHSVLRELEEALKSIKKSEIGLALLSSRHFALEAAEEVLSGLDVQVELRRFNAESHLK